MVEATIEDLDFPNRSSRAPGSAGRRGCLSVASSAASEKSEEGMALKNWSESIPEYYHHDPNNMEENHFNFGSL